MNTALTSAAVVAPLAMGLLLTPAQATTVTPKTNSAVEAQAKSGKRLYIAHSTYGEPSCLIVRNFTGKKRMRARTVSKQIGGDAYRQKLTLRKVRKNVYKTKSSYGDVYRFRFKSQKVRAKNWPLDGFTAPMYRASKCYWAEPIPD